MQTIQVHKIPFSPQYISGVTLLDGELVPVIVPEVMFGLTGKKGRDGFKQFIVVRTTAKNPETGQYLRLVIASYAGLQHPESRGKTDIRGFHTCSVPAFSANEHFLRATFEREEMCIMLLDFERIASEGWVHDP